MNFKNILIIVVLFPLSISTTDNFIYDDSTTEFDVFDDFNAETNDFLDSTQFAATTRQFDPEDIMEILVKVGAVEILTKQFYLHSNVLIMRDVLDLPIFPKDLDYQYDEVVSVNLFYDETTKSNFTPNHTNIGAYLAINNDDVIDAIKQSLQTIEPLVPNFNIPFVDLFELFSRALVQERRTGLMFQIMKKFGRFRFIWYTPLYYRERNFFITEEDQDAIEALLGKADPADQEDLQKNHLISDKFGIGDTRMYFDIPVLNYQYYKMHVGCLVTIPTAWTFVDGILGSSFKNKNTYQPTFSFSEMFDLGTDPDTQAQAAQIAEEFFLGALDRLAAILLDTSLGNNKHFGVGPFITTKTPLSAFISRPWAESIVLKGRMSIEYLFPAHEKRYFAEKTLANEFDTRNFNDPNQAASNLAFLEQTFVNRFYPYVFDTVVHPGIILMWTSKATFERPSYAIHLGTDTWIQSPEHFGTIDAPAQILRTVSVDKARADYWGYQWSVFATFALKARREDNDIIIALHLNCVAANSGVGEAFSGCLAFEKNF